MKYVLMFCETEQWDKAWEAMDQAERDAGFVKVQEWLARHADKITHHRKLTDPHTATTVRLDDGERRSSPTARSWKARRSSAATPRSRSPTSTRRCGW